jgi:hypothetical protein
MSLFKIIFDINLFPRKHFLSIISTLILTHFLVWETFSTLRSYNFGSNQYFSTTFFSPNEISKSQKCDNWHCRKMICCEVINQKSYLCNKKLLRTLQYGVLKLKSHTFKKLLLLFFFIKKYNYVTRRT